MNSSWLTCRLPPLMSASLSRDPPAATQSVIVLAALRARNSTARGAGTDQNVSTHSARQAGPSKASLQYAVSLRIFPPSSSKMKTVSYFGPA